MSETIATIPLPALPCQPVFPDPIPGVIAFGDLTLFAGAAGVGKTAMLSGWCARWRDGKSICGHRTNPPVGGFYYLAADRQWKSHQQWFDLHGFPDIAHYSLAEDLEIPPSRLMNPKASLGLLLEALHKLRIPPGAHLFIDPVAPFFIEGDQNRVINVAASMIRLSRLCVERQINITAVLHFSKQKADLKDTYLRPQDRTSGSGAFQGFSDTQIYLTDPTEDQPYYTLGWHSHHAPRAEFAFQRNEQGLFVPHLGPVTMKPEERLESLYALIPEAAEGIDVRDLVGAAHDTLKISRATVYRDLKKLKEEGRVEEDAWGHIMRRKPN